MPAKESKGNMGAIRKVLNSVSRTADNDVLRYQPPALELSSLDDLAEACKLAQNAVVVAETEYEKVSAVLLDDIERAKMIRQQCREAYKKRCDELNIGVDTVVTERRF
jgi:hypothetical protein